MNLKKYPIKGKKVILKPPLLIILRREGGLALIDVKSSSLRLIGGFFVFEDFAIGNKSIVAVTHNLVMIYDELGTLSKVLKLESNASKIAYVGDSFVVGTVDGVLVKFDEKGRVIWKKKIWDGKVDKIDVTESGYIIVVVSSTTMILLDAKGNVITTNSYQWDLTKVAWTKDMSFLAVPLSKSIAIYKWDEKQGYVKVKEVKLEEDARKIEWCENKLSIATPTEFIIYDYPTAAIKFKLKLELIDFSWNDRCDEVALLTSDYLYYLKDVNSIATKISPSST